MAAWEEEEEKESSGVAWGRRKGRATVGEDEGNDRVGRAAPSRGEEEGGRLRVSGKEEGRAAARRGRRRERATTHRGRRVGRPRAARGGGAPKQGSTLGLWFGLAGQRFCTMAKAGKFHQTSKVISGGVRRKATRSYPAAASDFRLYHIIRNFRLSAIPRYARFPAFEKS